MLTIIVYQKQFNQVNFDVSYILPISAIPDTIQNTQSKFPLKISKAAPVKRWHHPLLYVKSNSFCH